MTAPHDPAYAGEGRTSADGQPCNRGCGPWPCDERRRQRGVLRECTSFLRDALFRRVASGDRDVGRWTSPLGWSVELAYGDHGPRARVLAPGGAVEAESDNADFGWLAHAVP